MSAVIIEEASRYSRLERLREKITSRRLDGLLVAGRENISYLSGFSGGDAWALVTPDGAYLITDFRYREQAEEEMAPGFQLEEGEGGLVKTAAALCRKLRLKRVGFEKQHLSYAFHEELKARLKGRRLIPSGPWVEKSRVIKEAGEITLLKRSALLVSRELGRLLPSLEAGMTEVEVAGRIVTLIRKAGGREAFEPIVAAGPHSSQPHAVSAGGVLRAGRVLLVDMGVKVGRYNSDITRTFVLNDFPPRFKKIYGMVLDAQKKAIEAVAPGVKASLIDLKARGYLEAKGYGSYFGHALGHGVGLEVHESPRLHARSREVLQEGMVFTVEPALYLPGWGGVRIEDTVLVTSDGCEVLTRLPRDIASTRLALKSC